MILDIFSSFDPSVSYLTKYLSPIIFWSIIFISMTIFILSVWTTPSNLLITKNSLIKVINDQRIRTRGANIKGFNIFITALFITIINVNLIGLIPATFRYSRHLLFSLRLRLPLWMSLIISAIINNPYKWAARLLPRGAPHWLNPFLVIIESISISVRPLTLAFRLAANISAGHIVLTLIGTYCATFIVTSILSFIILIIVQTGYIIFEIGICIIQRYIFCLLLSLYRDDHP